MSPLGASGNGNNGRDSAGRFAPGNRLGHGSPLARRAAGLRAALLGAINPGDIASIARTLIDAALAGDTSAAKLVLGYAVGEPLPMDVLGTLDEIERKVRASREVD